MSTNRETLLRNASAASAMAKNQSYPPEARAAAQKAAASADFLLNLQDAQAAKAARERKD